MSLTIQKIDLIADWLEIIKRSLVNENYNIENLTDDLIFIEYYTIKNRKVSKKVRNIKKSSVFLCPEQLQTGLTLFEDKVLNGEDLLPHQSRNLKKLNIKDGMLFDWNIQHFHLGTEIENDGFIKRTGPLLYAYVDNANIYFLQILEHGNWTKKDLIKIIHENWPESIEHMKMNRNGEIMNISHNPTDEERKSLRNANINTFVQIDENNVYLGPGWGFSGSGNSIHATEEYLDNRRALKQIQDELIKSPDDYLLNFFRNLDFIKNKSLDFKLIFEDNLHKIIEINNNFEISLSK